MSTVRLADGRRLAFTEYGRADGFPVMYLHGAIGSPLGRNDELDLATDELRLRLVFVQRPGFGDSDQKPNRTLLDFSSDLEELADALALERFGVVGVSAGGPYAVACAQRLPQRITAAAAVSSLSPVCAPSRVPGLSARIRLPLRAIAAAPRLTTRVGDAALALVAKHPSLLLRAMSVGAPPADKRHLADGATSHGVIEAFLAATGGGIAGLVEDHLVTSRPWGFDLAGVTGDVHVWHGMHDAFVPVEHALQLVAALPNCRAWLNPGEGHFFFRRRVREILGALSGRSANIPARNRA